MWVAVGDNDSATGSIQYSYDGINWLNNTSGGFAVMGRAVASTNVWASPPTNTQTTIEALKRELFYLKGAVL
jgi:hypothetical protein